MGQPEASEPTIQIRIVQSNRKNSKYNYYGLFRTVGSLAIIWAYNNGAKNIDIVGMDGYSFYKKSDLASNKYSQHSYGKGFTDRKISKKEKPF